MKTALKALAREKVFYSLTWGRTSQHTESAIFDKLKETKAAAAALPSEYPSRTLSRHTHEGVTLDGSPAKSTAVVLSEV